MRSEQADARQNHPLPLLGVVDEVPDAVDGSIAARLLPRLNGKMAGHNMVRLDVPQFAEGLLPRVTGTGYEDRLHVVGAGSGKPRLAQISSHGLYGMEKIGLAPKAARRIVFRRCRQKAGMEFTAKRTRCRGIERVVHRAGLPLVLG